MFVEGVPLCCSVSRPTLPCERVTLQRVPAVKDCVVVPQVEQSCLRWSRASLSVDFEVEAMIRHDSGDSSFLGEPLLVGFSGKPTF